MNLTTTILICLAGCQFVFGDSDVKLDELLLRHPASNQFDFVFRYRVCASFGGGDLAIDTQEKLVSEVVVFASFGFPNTPVVTDQTAKDDTESGVDKHSRLASEEVKKGVGDAIEEYCLVSLCGMGIGLCAMWLWSRFFE